MALAWLHCDSNMNKMGTDKWQLMSRSVIWLVKCLNAEYQSMNVEKKKVLFAYHTINQQ